ncbi:MAG: bifunctional (p)ppGpp synthetase/guanosine-3',5'-bis(diphosphate) 3'-pyrophosphohydrolase [Oscillospiraceae bacterium]|jgi:guanosine-3',5'-bis(diphosphate) 3'-pyrophosphohydrolase|nr:bifunctional (p)ppGpp synthetase/guanosine-3',5'-bis(diphosphate) 3'-pyrophosphohydrolase [Oscillospiraceae bacterium]MCI8943968.1 bifunctional (p)ppGpp synthetase/guanosine-3',5'-bis(diphosphate) 3'-pyrophosphohydrolase [Oscillospiraceae bacterium]
MVSVEERYEHLEKTIRGYNISADLTQIRAAYEYAREHHGEQMRRDGSPYITHPIHVAQIVAEMRLDSESIIAALLHDCIEDTDCTYEDIAKRFGVTVADIVDGVTKLTRVKYSTMEEEQMENLRKMLFAMSRDIRVILIKIADRLHNMRTMEYQTPAKQKKKAFETMEIYAPIAHRLGLAKMKWELEDLSLKYLDPVAYDEINRKLAQASAEHGQFMSRVQEEISCRLLELNVPHATVYGRVKHPYSIYRKMYLQEKTMEELYDLFAFRVLVDTVKDCYNVLGVVHDIYKPILGRFKDYIATPKPNMYQSLHTTVIGEEGIPFEVQIRTYDMHAINEYGVAAHWKYKQGIKKEGGEADYEWIRRLLENQEDADAEEFIHSLKVDMFADEVFVFTPRGDVINLPAGATPIDFAYSIHSAIGNTMVGAKINGRMVGFDYQLHNGDVVEINTSKAAHGPSRDWMKIAKSSEARSKIRQWFKRERREENIAQGRASFESELKHVGLTMSQITASDVLPSILKRVSFQSLDEMYAAIGYGGLTALKAVNRVRDELLQINRAAAMAKAAEEAAAKAAQEAKAAQQSALPKKVKSEKGIVVEGLSNCLVKFSKCCAPVPGDEIIGFITRGYGVSVHRRDCPNAQPDHHVEANQGRWIKVSWSDDIRDSYTTGLEVVCKDRANLLVDISTAVSTCKVNISNLNVHTTADGFAIFHLTLSVTDSRQLDQVMRKIHQISSVMKVNRPAG